MATTNPTTMNDRPTEVCALAWQLMDVGAADSYEDALQQAHGQLDELLAFAEAWNGSTWTAQARVTGEAEELELDEAELDMVQCGRCGEWLPAVEMSAGCPACHAEQLHREREAAELVYVPGVLTPAETRATDKALFEHAGGVRPRFVGRHAFVPSRSNGGVVYRLSLDGSSCTCEAGQHGRPCWHSRLVLLERELAA